MQTQTAAHEQPRTKQRADIDDQPTLYGLARDTLRETGNDAGAAEEILFSRLVQDKELLRVLVSGVVKMSVNASVNVVLINQRAAAYNSVANIERNKAGAMALANGIASALLDMPLADGTRLRDATKVEVEAAADLYEKRANTYAHRARFLRAVADKLPPGKRCGAVLSEAKTRQIYQNAA